MNVIKIICIILLIFILLFALWQITPKEKNIVEEKKMYQGPVQEGYDEQKFRETGIHEPIKENEIQNSER